MITVLTTAAGISAGIAGGHSRPGPGRRSPYAPRRLHRVDPARILASFCSPVAIVSAWWC